MKRYSPSGIEQKWQDKWEQDGTYTVDLSDHSKPKYFGMSMLPGITGAGIHIGHGRTFQFSDIKVRAKRQQGFNAYNPIGWDSFGLPVENYAIKLGKKPREAHNEAKVNFKKQLKRLGYSYDWTKEISTADPSYYKWTQWIFNQLFSRGLAYQKESPQWWCETDQTVLANEQVEGGKCWRCGNPVVKRNLKQWFFKITEYAEEMLEATDDLNWTDMVKTMQKNWIGKSQGAEIDFQLSFAEERLNEWKDDSGKPAHITVFTTRPDTLFGATFMVLAPEHPWVTAALEQTGAFSNSELVRDYIKQTQAKSEIERQVDTKEKTGVMLQGVKAINPATGEKIPIWIGDYVLAGYGTGAIMAVPGHDERDLAYAEAFRLPVKTVIEAEFGIPNSEEVKKDSIIAIVRNPKNGKVLTLDWGPRKNNHGGTMFIGGGMEEGEDPIETAKREITEETGYVNVNHVTSADSWVNNHFYSNVKNKYIYTRFMPLLFELENEEQVEQNLDDNENQFTVKWVDEAKLETVISEPAHFYGYQTLLPSHILHGEGVLINSGAFDGMRSEQAREEIVAWLEEQGVGQSKVTYKMRDWLISRQRYWGAPIPIIHCPEHGAVPVPDDQLPVILPDVDDYKPSGGNVSALAGVTDWVNTTCPICESPAKRETDTMDGYACSSWYFLRYLDPFNDQQAWDPDIEAHWGPVDFYNGGDHAVAHLLYSRFWMRFFHTLGLTSHPEPFDRMMYNAFILAPGGEKMSKSKGNVIDPLEIIESGYGADSLRVYEMFIAPFDMDAPWDVRGVPGTYRFLNRVWTLAQEYAEAGEVALDEKAAAEILAVAHKTVKKVTDDIENDKFNTAVSTMMEAVNTYFKLKETYSIGKSDAWKFAIESLLQVLAPFAPHITEELWHQLGHDSTIHVDTWPKWDNSYLQTSQVNIMVQVNGKLRAKLIVAKDISEEDAKQLALSDEHVMKFVGDSVPVKVIYVPGRLINIVI
ncbi:MAG TPA: class I tRNA ligase family protein [Candidatus Saccharimonadales bacterium]|nr:class I tRNA ligase family protein [Candidatus Saccharimonadales bacterium]